MKPLKPLPSKGHFVGAFLDEATGRRYLTLKAAARLLGIERNTLQRYCAAGKTMSGFEFRPGDVREQPIPTHGHYGPRKPLQTRTVIAEDLLEDLTKELKKHPPRRYGGGGGWQQAGPGRGHKGPMRNRSRVVSHQHG